MAVNLERELFQVTRKLNEAEIQYAVCGGLAMALHGFVRATRDIDILIRREDLERVQVLVEECGYIIPAGLRPFGTGTPKFREIFRVSKVIDGQLIPLDLMLLAPSFQSAWDTRISAQLEGHSIIFVSKAGLTEMKRIAGRSQDLTDIERLTEASEGGTNDGE